MDFRRTRLVGVAVTVAAVLSAVQLCNVVSMPQSPSIAGWLLFASSVFGIQRIYSAAVDIFVIHIRPAARSYNRVA